MKKLLSIIALSISCAAFAAWETVELSPGERVVTSGTAKGKVFLVLEK